MENKGTDTRERIVSIAFKLFLERGIAEVSINDLIKEVGIAKGGFYHHFKSKDELIYEIIEKIIYPYLNKIIKNIDEFNCSAKEKILEIFKSHYEAENYVKTTFNIDKISERSIIILIVECIKRYETVATFMVEFANKLIEKVQKIIEVGKENGEFSNTIDSKSAATYIVSALEGSTALWVINPNINMKVLFENNFYFMWNSLK